MIKRNRGTRLAGLLVLGWLALERPVGANFHLMMVVEVFPGYASSPNAQYVELQMYSAGQNFLAGHPVHFFNAAGMSVGTFTFPSDMANGANQANILIATTEAQTLFGVTADLTMTPLISAAGGKLCFDTIDCVAWGNYVPVDPTVGTPFSPGGLTLAQAMQRRLDPGSPGVLDPSDDNNDCATDFTAAAPTPRNNANVVGAVAGYSSTPAAPGPISFGSVVVGFPASASLSVLETGGRTLTLSNPVPGGANPGDFALVTSFPVNIADGAPAQAVQLTCTPSAQGSRTATLTFTTNDPLRTSVAYDLTCTGLPPPPGLDFFTVTPCRVVDTRVTGGPLAAGVDRIFTVAGGTSCIPSGAAAVSINVAVFGPTSAGNVRVYPAGGLVPNASTINYAAGQTRTNNALVGLSVAGELAARCQPTGTTHLIIDVNGYFQ